MGKRLISVGIVFSLGLLALPGCRSRPSAAERVRRYFEMPKGQEVTSQNVRSAVLAKLPQGATVEEICSFLEKRGIGRDELSSYYPMPEERQIICRIDFDPKSSGLVKESYGVFFLLSKAGGLQDIQIEKWLTGP